MGWHGTRLWFLQGQPEQFADEPNLTPNIIATDPPNLPFPNHVPRFITPNGSPGGMELSKALRGIDPAFNCPMILFNDVIQVLDRPMTTSGAQYPFLLNSGDSRGVDGRKIGIDDARLRM